MKKKQPAKPARVYTSDTMTRFMALSNPERRKDLERELEMGRVPTIDDYNLPATGYGIAATNMSSYNCSHLKPVSEADQLLLQWWNSATEEQINGTIGVPTYKYLKSKQLI